MNNYEMILCIVDAGFSELVMDAAKEEGARGGTVIHARGTANKEAEQFFHIAIQPDKDIVMILVPAEIKDNVLHAIYRNAGLK
ncbi:MAG: P-II family nitrogen regulator, partial [Clostridia bacterium]|nr:P-II family nitrogen regulator [Clostridia bacterium]